MPEVTNGLDALTMALNADDEKQPVAGEPEVKEPEPELEESQDADAEPEKEAEAQDETDENSEVSVVELPIKDKDGNPIQATVEELQEWRENGLRQADYSRSMNELASQRQEAERIASESRQRVEQETQRYVEQLQQLQAAVLMTVAPELRGVDWTQLAAQAPQEYVRLRAKYDQTQQVLAAIEGEHKQIVDKRSAEMQEAQAKAAAAAVSELQRDIPGWSQETYSNLMNYAVSMGYSEQEVLNATDAKAFKVLWKASQYDQLQKAKPAVQQKLNALPKVIKPGTQSGKVTSQTRKINDAVQAHKKSGSVRSLAQLLNNFD